MNINKVQIKDSQDSIVAERTLKKEIKEEKIALVKFSTGSLLLWGPFVTDVPGGMCVVGLYAIYYFSSLCSHLSQCRPSPACWSGAGWHWGFPERLREAKQSGNINGHVTFRSLFIPSTQTKMRSWCCLSRLATLSPLSNVYRFILILHVPVPCGASTLHSLL